MEDHHHHHHHHNCRPSTKAVLSIDVSCCDGCRKVLENRLNRMEEVEAFKINVEEDIVEVSGTMDPVTLLNDLARLGREVKLLPNEKYVNKGKNHLDEDERMEGRQCPTKDKASTSRNRKQHPKPRYGQQYNKAEEEHKCEAYVAPEFSAKVCGDIYCSDHPRGRKVLDRVPEDKSFFGFSHSGCNGYCGGYPCYDPYQGGYYGRMSFGYNGRPSSRPFGFY